MNRFLDLADFPREQIKDLLGLAARLQQHPQPQALAGKVLGLLFLNPSLRTLASFQSAMMRLGGTAVVITPGQGTWQMETRSGAIMNGAAAEHVREAVPVLASYCDAMGIRMFAEGRNLAADLAETGFRMMADLCDKPLVNMESAMSHPCQALADWHTLDELRVPERGKFVLSWTNHPRALPLAVPSSTVHMAAMRGMEVVVLRPDGFALPEQIMEKARQAAKASGGAVHETTDRAEALSGAHVVYAKEWGSQRSRRAAARVSRRLVREGQLVQDRRPALPFHALPAGASQCRRRGRGARRLTQRRGARGVQSHGRADGRVV
jgi:N-acetylornithine carbamoyltransferase